MKKVFCLVPIVFIAVMLDAGALSTITFNNKSGHPVLVKLIGPTYKEIHIQARGQSDVSVSAGQYTFRARYGIPGNYHYRRSKPFEIIESGRIRSTTTITLQLEDLGDLSTQPISEDGFESAGTPFSLGCRDESETGIAWAKFLLNEDFIHPKAKRKVEYAITVSAGYADMMQSGDVEYIEPNKIGFLPVALSKVITVLGNWEQEDKEADMRLLRWGGLVLKCDIRTQQVVSFGFRKAFYSALSRNTDIMAQAGKCLHDSMQLAAKRSSPWRQAERKFCELIGLPDLPDTLDNGERKGMIGYSTIAKNTNLTEAKIKTICGESTQRIPGNSIYSGAYYGRVGYKTKAGRMLPDLWIFYSLSSVEEMIKKNKGSGLES